MLSSFAAFNRDSLSYLFVVPSFPFACCIPHLFKTNKILLTVAGEVLLERAIFLIDGLHGLRLMRKKITVFSVGVKHGDLIRSFGIWVKFFMEGNKSNEVLEIN